MDRLQYWGEDYLDLVYNMTGTAECCYEDGCNDNRETTATATTTATTATMTITQATTRVPSTASTTMSVSTTASKSTTSVII